MRHRSAGPSLRHPQYCPQPPPISLAPPTTAWLFAKGAWLEQDFKRFQRRHQIPTDVWYKAYPGLTAQDLARNSRIRNGVEKAAMSDDEIRRWVAEI